MNISKKLFKKTNFNIQYFYLKKKKKRRIEIYHSERISVKKYRCIVDTKSHIVYKLFMCAHVGQTSTIYGHDTMNYLFIVLSIGETLGTKVLHRNVGSSGKT